MMVDVQDTKVQARWPEWGDWQRFFIQKKDGNGAILPGDRVILQAHTGKMLDVQGGAVAANWHDTGDWQTFILETRSDQAASRRLSEAESISSVAHTVQAVMSFAMLLIVAASILCGCLYLPEPQAAKVDPLLPF